MYPACAGWSELIWSARGAQRRKINGKLTGLLLAFVVATCGAGTNAPAMEKGADMPEKYTSFIELMNAWVGGAFTTIIASLLGRFMWHGNEARKGRRKFFGIELFWELPVALGMAVIGESAAAYADLGQPASTGLIALLAYLGPRGVEALFHKWFDRRMAG